MQEVPNIIAHLKILEIVSSRLWHSKLNCKDDLKLKDNPSGVSERMHPS